jgi:hypothetical protein
LDPSQETRVATFFNESLFFDTVFVKNPLRTQKLILFSGTEPELMQRMQMIFRRRRAELRAARIIYIDQHEVEALPHGKRWGSAGGAGLRMIEEFTKSLTELLFLRSEGMGVAETVLIAHSAFAGVAGAPQPIVSTPSIASRTIRQVRSCLETPRVHLVLHERTSSDKLKALYSHNTTCGGRIDPGSFLSTWENSPANVIEQLVTEGIIRATDVHVERVASPGVAVATLAKVDNGLADGIVPLSPNLAEPFTTPRSLRASQILARMNRHKMSPTDIDACRAFVDNEFDTLVREPGT